MHANVEHYAIEDRAKEPDGCLIWVKQHPSSQVISLIEKNLSSDAQDRGWTLTFVGRRKPAVKAALEPGADKEKLCFNLQHRSNLPVLFT
jgi:hypothetical protein